ncbi:MAG: Crp/Fnr family transcriptional regulator [Sphingomonas bacterium]|uniref:Crp/Fnr family transcriptional regulator n=1 Tax=Sphingomonas bacterium TaxID=1895847 RepID=UPI002607477A|nr:Crp/Fnr family transcriptional regulator [Sphingomonas bacterium]MDB5694781.1 Crp/Fnr family transcriptional regulator [Sphingomonas bacterium]
MPRSDATLEPLVRKLALHSDLLREEREALLSLRFERRPLRAHAQLFRGVDPALHCCVLLDGYAAGYKLLRDGSRQILNVLMRGDLVGIQRCLFQRADHEVEMLTDGTVATIAAADLQALMSAHSGLSRAIWSESLFHGAIQSEWIVNVGRRSASARLGHLLCELGVRNEQQGLGSRDQFELPLTQANIADCAGLTAVHINRTLRSLDEAGLIRRGRGRVTIPDWAGLTRMAGFDEQYLKPKRAEVSVSPRHQQQGA